MEVADESETLVSVYQIHGVIFYKSLIQILLGLGPSLHLEENVLETVLYVYEMQLVLCDITFAFSSLVFL
jgi:hypothetical protein